MEGGTEEQQAEEYIDMDVSSSATFADTAAGSPPHAREFEFCMASTVAVQGNPITSPADELFYKGKLLPLHLPPRLQMVQRLLEEPGGARAPPSATRSCTVSPASSCYVSGELSAEDFLTQPPLQKKSWSKTLKLIRQSSLGLKFRASKDYLKCIFTRPAKKAGELHHPSTSPFRLAREGKTADECSVHRRSFTGVLNHHPSLDSSSSSSCTPSSSSSSSSSSSASSSLKRSSSANSEVECSIQGAIAYCKKSSQQAAAGRKSFGDVGCCALSHSKVAAAPCSSLMVMCAMNVTPFSVADSKAFSSIISSPMKMTPEFKLVRLFISRDHDGIGDAMSELADFSITVTFVFSLLPT